MNSANSPNKLGFTVNKTGFFGPGSGSVECINNVDMIDSDLILKAAQPSNTPRHSYTSVGNDVIGIIGGGQTPSDYVLPVSLVEAYSEDGSRVQFEDLQTAVRCGSISICEDVIIHAGGIDISNKSVSSVDAYTIDGSHMIFEDLSEVKQYHDSTNAENLAIFEGGYSRSSGALCTVDGYTSDGTRIELENLSIGVYNQVAVPFDGLGVSTGGSENTSGSINGQVRVYDKDGIRSEFSPLSYYLHKHAGTVVNNLAVIFPGIVNLYGDALFDMYTSSGIHQTSTFFIEYGDYRSAITVGDHIILHTFGMEAGDPQMFRLFQYS